jgi:probable HAF family extracellular repeat protein
MTEIIPVEWVTDIFKTFFLENHIMKNVSAYLIIVLACVSILISGCVETGSDEGGNNEGTTESTNTPSDETGGTTGGNITERNSGKYKIIDLDPSAINLFADTVGAYNIHEINNHGRMVGSSPKPMTIFGEPNGEMQSTLYEYSSTVTKTFLGTLSGTLTSQGWGINNLNQVVGYVPVPTGIGIKFVSHAVLFDTTGNENNIDLDNISESESQAISINDKGQIVGYEKKINSPQLAIIFDSTGKGKNRLLGALKEPYTCSMVGCINNSGNIVGYASNRADDDQTRAVLFDASGQGNNIDLGTLGGQSGYAAKINDLGQIVGASQTSSGEYHATLFDATGKGNNIDLGLLEGGKRSDAASINNVGQIVGLVTINPDTQDGSGNKAVLFDKTGNGHNIDLNEVIDQSSGWVLYSAVDINDNGWIVGKGKGPDGVIRGFLLIPN